MSSTVSLPLADASMDIHADQRGRIIGSCVAIFVITDVFVLLRLVSRKLARAGYWWDDVLALVAMVFSNILCIIWFCELRNGYGRHIYVWPASERVQKERNWRRDFFIFELFFHTAITICKLSVIAFYYRIFPFRQFRNILLVVAALSLGYGISIDVTILFQCRPLHYQWDLADPTAHGTCVNFHAFFVGKGIANAVLNALIFVLPIPLLWRLRVTLRQQVVLTSIFTLAGFVIIVSIVWIIVVPDVTQPDITWGSVNFGIWSTLEPNIAVICACIPSLRPLVTVVRNGVFQHPLLARSLRSNIPSIRSSKPKWAGARGGGGGGDSTNVSGPPDGGGGFSRLDEMDDLRPLGHRVEARSWTRPASGAVAAGGDEEGERLRGSEMAVPNWRIGVKTDVVVETSERLTYNDRLY